MRISRGRLAVALLVILVIAGTYFTGRFYFSPGHQAKLRLNDWLKTIESGKPDKEFWVDPSLSKKFFAPRTHKIISQDPATDSDAAFTIQLESSNQGGAVVVKNWAVFMKKIGPNWKIDFVIPGD